MKRFFALAALMATVCMALTGCFGNAYPQPTIPPQQTFGSAEDFAVAVAKAKADASLEDAENLKGLTHYYELNAVPENYKLNAIMASVTAVIVEYASGPVSEEKYDNRIQFGWYRDVNVSSFLNDRAQSMSNSGMEYDTITIGDISYLHTVPTVYVNVTNSPGVTAAATPTPTETKPCQVLYWVQDGNAFVGIFPISFTNDDLGKYCRGLKADLK